MISERRARTGVTLGQGIFRFFAEDRNSSAQWRMADATVAQRKQAIDRAHATATALGQTDQTQGTRTFPRIVCGGGASSPLWRVWRVLCPSWRDWWAGDAHAEAGEAAAMLLLAAMRTVELNLQTQVVRSLERALSTRNLVRVPSATAVWRKSGGSSGSAVLHVHCMVYVHSACCYMLHVH